MALGNSARFLFSSLLVHVDLKEGDPVGGERCAFDLERMKFLRPALWGTGVGS